MLKNGFMVQQIYGTTVTLAALDNAQHYFELNANTNALSNIC